VVHTTIKQLPKPHKVVLSSILSFMLILLIFPSESVNASRQVQELEPGKRYDLTLEIDHAQEKPVFVDTSEDWQTYKVRKGDNLAKIFARAGLSPKDVYQVSRAGKDARKLLKIMPGDELKLRKDTQQGFVALNYALSATRTLHIDKDKQGKLQSFIESKEVNKRYAFANGNIESSFWNAGLKAGMTENQIMSLAGIFGWDIDFALELRKGDRFHVVFEEKFVDGDFVGYGDIIAAEFLNQGETFTAIRHDDGDYYSPEGRSMRKSFLRAPVSFKYISSSFKPRRFHPVQKRWKAHRGTDYAANRGTPVVAAGNGKVIRARYDKYNGNHVFIQHGEKYTTKYLHFSKRPKVKKGQSVKQGQVIGYVGSTGLAAGPHLHYEFLVDGVHRNPRTVKLPKAQPIAKKHKERFLQISKEYMAMLDNNKRIMLAMN